MRLFQSDGSAGAAIGKFRSRYVRRGVQSGQALIVILSCCAFLGAGLFSVYNTAQLAIAKRELVNAADASAYSGASIIAQGLNYTAYTNRAILANNALIGQMMTIRSSLAMSQWYWKNTEKGWKVFEAITRFIPLIGGLIASFAGAVAMFAKFWGSNVVYPTQVMAEALQVVGTAAIGLSNQVMWLSQQVHLADSLASFEPNMIQIAQDNAPDASVDAVLHGTAFGPAVTLGMFAAQFKIKKRSATRTMGTAAAAKDEYLNYVSEINHDLTAPAYVAGRTLLPNAVGLWIATGCDTPGSAAVGGMSGAFAPAAGLGSSGDTAARAFDTFLSFLSIIANPLMCLYDRHGGSEMIQLADGKMAWVAIDAMTFNVPELDFHIPMAGGATMSFTERGRSQRPFPEALQHFEAQVGHNRLFNQENKPRYMGHQTPQPPDCIEFLSPGNWDMYAVSSNTLTTGTCAVLASGTSEQTRFRGIWGGDLREAAEKTIRSSDSGSNTANLLQPLTTPLASTMHTAVGQLQAQVSLPAAQAPTITPPGGLVTPMPAGVSAVTGTSTTGLPNTSGLQQAGASIATSSWMSGISSVRTSLLGLAQRLNPANFTAQNPARMLESAVGGVGWGSQSDGDGPDFWDEELLNELGLGSVVQMFSMKVSDGVETPRTPILNNIFNTLADGLPPYFWDVRVLDPVQGRQEGEAEDLQFTDGNHDDYNRRRYNLGPIVYLPLIKDFDKVRTTGKIGMNGAVMGLPDYDANRNVLRAIGKARIFFRQPSDHWLTRYKQITTASLLLPYWQVRNEGLSYADKWGLMTIDGVTIMLNDFGDGS